MQNQYTVKDLAQFIKKQKKDELYTFFTGAGCSVSAGIPLAKEIVKEINEKYPLELKPLSVQEKGTYVHCMKALDKKNRKALIQNHVTKAKINWFHIALATLLKQNFIQRVLTFNFDNLMIRSCGLLGFYPATYDLTHINIDLHKLIDDSAIIYVHGQSHGLSLLNTHEETEAHANKLASFIADTLNSSPCIFIGYSGENDAFFDKLYDKHDGQHRLFWVGIADTPPAHVQRLLKKNPHITHYIQCDNADTFLISLAQEIGCFPPELFINPYRHLLTELKAITPYPLQKASTEDILINTKDALEKQADKEDNNTASKIEAHLMEGKYEILTQLPATEIDSLNEHSKQLVAWAFIMQANTLSETGKIEKDENLFQQACDKYAKAITIKPDMHEVWSNWGFTLVNLAHITKDEKLFKQAFKKYDHAISIKPDMYTAWNNWGNALADLAEIKKDETLFQKSFDKYNKATSIKPNKAENWSNWGVAIANLAEIKKDETLFQQSFDKYAKAISIKPDMYTAWNNWGNALADLAKIKKDEILFQQSFDKYTNAISIKPDLSEAWYNWGNTLLTLYHLTTKEKQANILKEAEKVLLKAQEIDPDDTYNLACLYALKGELASCKEKLMHCEKRGTLPSKEHLLTDKDLAHAQQEAWFKELIARMA